MAGRHQVGVAADLAELDVAARNCVALAVAATVCPLPRGILWRGRGRVLDIAAERSVGGRSEGHAVHTATHLGLAELLLEELQVSSAIAHLRVESRSNGLVVCLRTHSIGGIKQRLFALNLLEDVLDGVFFVHVGRWGCATPRAGEEICGVLWWCWCGRCVGYGLLG